MSCAKSVRIRPLDCAVGGRFMSQNLMVLKKGQVEDFYPQILQSKPPSPMAFPLPDSLQNSTKEDKMFKKLFGLGVGLMLSVNVALASTADRKNLQVFNDVSTSVNRYVHFTIFDDVQAEVKDGIVTLTGRVTMPYKRNDIEKRVAKIDGVREVRDHIAVLPVSGFDNRLRYQIARAIYGHPNFWNYAIGPNPSIHIVVEHGHVRLTGVVINQLDRQLARTLVNQFGVMSVANELKTEAEVRDALEKL